MTMAEERVFCCPSLLLDLCSACTSSTGPLLVTIPHCRAIARAVRPKSPVTWNVINQLLFIIRERERQTIKILIPALLSVWITSGISSLGGSTMPTRPTRTRPVLAWLSASASNSRDDGGILISLAGRTLRASRITRLPSPDQRSLSLVISVRSCPSSVCTLPSTATACVHRSIRISGAPLIVRRLRSVSARPPQDSALWQLTCPLV